LTRIYDQQFVGHVFASVRGRGSDAACRAVEEIWQGTEPMFGMTGPIAGTSLPSRFPDSASLRPAAAAGGEVTLAARERPDGTGQAVLRLHHDILNLSVALAPPEARSPSPAANWPWWRNLGFQWGLLLAPHAVNLVGEARLFLTRIDAEAAIQAADPALYTELTALLPDADGGGAVGSTPAGVPVAGGFAIWEAEQQPDDRAVRRLVIPIAPRADQAASAWVWSSSTPVIPPLARYLLHAAKIRYELRVLERDSHARQLRESLDDLGAELRQAPDGDPARRELFRLRQMDAVMLHADLLALRRTVEAAADNLSRCFDLTSLLVPGGMFADDSALAGWLLDRLDDEAGRLAIASDRARQLSALLPPFAPSPPGPDPGPDPGLDPSLDPGPDPGLATPDRRYGPGQDRRRNVFVVYGRDDPARRAIFEFLRSLGLRPLEWEELVQTTGKAAPFLGEAVRKGLELAAAAVVLLTPEDVVHLHPDLHGPREPATETAPSMQARPNVILELGMALALKPEGTLVLLVGEQRPMTDLGGMSYVRLSGDPDCRSRIADRLKVAGCLVNPVGTDWLKTGDFASLAAQHRTPAP
jgi:predicted nucleotide-binding protein